MLNGDYLPARSVFKNVGKIQGKMQMISIKVTSNNRIYLTMPFGNKKIYYEQIAPNIFFCKDASPEEKILAFKVTDGKVSSVSFRLAHDYVLASKTQGHIGFIIGFATYASTTMIFFILLATQFISLLKNRRKCMQTRIWFCIAGTVLGLSGIIGMVHWFSIYEILAHELILITAIGWIFCIAGVLCGGYTYFKERSFKNGVLLLGFIAQIFSAYYIGILTVI